MLKIHTGEKLYGTFCKSSFLAQNHSSTRHIFIMLWTNQNPEMLLPGGGGGGGGALKAEVLNRAAKAVRGESMRGGCTPLSLGGSGDLPQNFIKIYVSENAFQAILKPIFPYSITSILSKVRHSNTLFFAINFSFPCHPLGALVRLCVLL